MNEAVWMGRKENANQTRELRRARQKKRKQIEMDKK
jgi:hypothetical protein